MSYSNGYLHVLNKKNFKNDLKMRELKKIFFDFMKDCPDELIFDLLNYYFPNYKDDSIIDLKDAEKLSEIIILFYGEYEEEKINIDDKELLFISEGVNDFALELSDETIFNVMRIVVARGLINHGKTK